MDDVGNWYRRSKSIDCFQRNGAVCRVLPAAAALLAHRRCKLLPMTKRFVHTAHKYTFQARLLQQHGLCLPLSVAAVCLLDLNWIPVAFENTKCTVTITMQVLMFVPCTLRQISLEASITANAASGGTSMIPQCSTSSQCWCHADQACTIIAMS